MLQITQAPQATQTKITLSESSAKWFFALQALEVLRDTTYNAVEAYIQNDEVTDKVYNEEYEPLILQVEKALKKGFFERVVDSTQMFTDLKEV